MNLPLSKEKQSYFVCIPPSLVEAIHKQLRLKNPSLEEIETVTLWCLAGSLAGTILNDTLIEEKTSKKALQKLRWETSEYLKDLQKMRKENV